MLWTIELRKNIQMIRKDKNNYSIREKGCGKILLFDSIPIEKYIFSLLHADISADNKIIYSYFEWINERNEPLSDEEINMITFLINLKIEQKTSKII